MIFFFVFAFVFDGFLFLNLFLSLISPVQSGSYVRPGFPFLKMTNWHNIHPKQISCQFTGGDASTYSTTTYNVAFFDNQKVVDSEEVTLCSIWTFETECYEHWYLSTDIAHIRRPMHARLNDCVTEIANGEISVSRLPDENYPDPECYWLKKYTTSRKVVHLEKIKIHFDYYTNSLVDHRLLTGKCNKKYCEGTSDNVLIVRHEDYESHCNSWKKEKVHISDHMIKVSGSNVEYYIEQTCDLTFCGKMGKRLSHGLFIHVPDTSAYWALKRTVSCHGADATVSSNPVISRELNLEGDKEGFMAYRDCLEAKDMIVISGQVTSHLLSQIAPMRAWYLKGDVYRFANNSLQVATGSYRAMDEYPPTSPRGCLKGGGQVRCFSFSSWVFDALEPQPIPPYLKNKTTLLINGIILSQRGEFSYPSNWRWIQIQNRELEQLDPFPIKHFVDDHPVFQKESLSEIKNVQETKHFSITDLFSGSWYRKLIWSVIFILSGIAVIVILYKIILCIPWSKTYKSAAELRVDRLSSSQILPNKPVNVF